LIRKVPFKFSLIFLLLLLPYFFLWQKNPYTSKDADRYFHFAISRAAIEQGKFINSLPQVEFLGWGEYFPDKEFLFHIITSTAYRIGSEHAIIITLTGIAISIIFISFYMGNLIIGVSKAAFLIFLFFLGSPLFMLRLTYIRPHVLAIFLFSFFCFAFIKKNKFFSFLSLLLFSLSYHAFYIPIFFLFCIVLVLVLKKEQEFFPSYLLWAISGLLIGILINPYFPSNLIMGIEHALIALRGEDYAKLAFGQELIPQELGFSLRNFLPYGILLFSAPLLFRKKTPSLELCTFFLVSVIFWVLFFKSPRAIEYAIPSSLILFFYLWKELPQNKKIINLLFFSALIQSTNIYSYYIESKTINSVIPLLNFEKENVQAIQSIPKKNKMETLYHCNWSIGSYILYYRPDLHFIDILDPSFLLRKNKEIFAARELLNNGRIANPDKILRELFHANYVICDNPLLVKQLSKSKNWTLLYKGNGTSYLFALR